MRGFRVVVLLAGVIGCEPEAPAPSRLRLDQGLLPDVEPSSSAGPHASPAPRRCPQEMVDVGGRFCIDRFEASLVESGSGRRLSPYHHPSRELALRDHGEWSRRAGRSGPFSARRIALPELPSFQREREVELEARSEPGKIPNAYLDLESARRACTNAGKRLCTRAEWETACRGQHRTRHPYGERFDPTRCNVGRTHPAAMLHGKGELGSLDPRMNLLEDARGALLAATGVHSDCASPWGDDAVYDMVGNLDEWIDDPSGVFLGAFYARDTAWGCDARIEIHSADYYDYTLGARCCR